LTRRLKLVSEGADSVSGRSQQRSAGSETKREEGKAKHPESFLPYHISERKVSYHGGMVVFIYLGSPYQPGPVPSGAWRSGRPGLETFGLMAPTNELVNNFTVTTEHDSLHAEIDFKERKNAL
jgi:hypothetical protein